MTLPFLTLDQLIIAATKYAEAKLIGKSDVQIAPIFHVQFKDRPPSIMLAPWTNEREKEAFIAALRHAMKIFNASVVSYSFISEAWQAEEGPGHPSGIQPMDREDKREVVMINACDSVESRLTLLSIQRDDKGRVTALTPDPHPPIGLGGRLLNLMEDET